MNKTRTAPNGRMVRTDVLLLPGIKQRFTAAPSLHVKTTTELPPQTQTHKDASCGSQHCLQHENASTFT